VALVLGVDHGGRDHRVDAERLVVVEVVAGVGAAADETVGHGTPEHLDD
jgi:hypothetical protein